MACKTMNEAVVEGMGGMWDRCASDGRHPEFETGAEEAVIAWSAPAPYHPAAVEFINHSLNDVFGFAPDGTPLKWNFQHIDSRAGVWNAQSAVVKRHRRNDKPKLPDEYYNISS